MASSDNFWEGDEPKAVPPKTELALAVAMSPTMDITKAPKTRPAAAGGAGMGPVTSFTQTIGMSPSNIEYIRNPNRLRQWAETNELIVAAIKIIKDRVSSAEWVIGPVDQGKPMDELFKRDMEWLLNHPNPMVVSWRSFISPIIEDICALDQGVIEKEYTASGEIYALWPVDGGRIGYNKRWFGEANKPRYFYRPEGLGGKAIPMMNDELVTIQQNAMTYRKTGLSPLTALAMTIDSIIVSDQYQLEMAKQHPPSGLVMIPNVGQDQVEAIKSKYETEVAGRKATFFLGYSTEGEGARATYYPLVYNAQTMQWESWQQLLLRKVAIVFGLSPMSLGMERDVNRNTAESQENQATDNGLFPLMQLLQGYINREVIDASPRAKSANCQFIFTQLTDRDQQASANIARILTGGVPIVTVNEARHINGFGPINGGDVILAIGGASGVTPVLGDDSGLIIPEPPKPVATGNASKRYELEAQADPVLESAARHAAKVHDALEKIVQDFLDDYRAHMYMYERVDTLKTREIVRSSVDHGGQKMLKREQLQQMGQGGESIGSVIYDMACAVCTATINEHLKQLGEPEITQIGSAGSLGAIVKARSTGSGLMLLSSIVKDSLAWAKALPDDLSREEATAQLLEKTHREVSYRASRVARTVAEEVRTHATREFVERNMLTGQARVVPEYAHSEDCQKVVEQGWVDLGVAMRWSVPSHPNCIHHIECQLKKPSSLHWNGS